jgi:hypothetical protein
MCNAASGTHRKRRINAGLFEPQSVIASLTVLTFKKTSTGGLDA